MTSRPEVPLIADEHEDDRRHLRAALASIAEAINTKNWSALDDWLDLKVAITMIDQTTMHGREDLSRYIESKLRRYGSILADFQVEPVPDAPAIFHGDTAICTVSSGDRFILRSGRELLVQDRYTATLVKKDGAWKLVALHAGANAFNNPISFQLQKFLFGGVVVAGAAGTLLGWLLGRREG